MFSHVNSPSMSSVLRVSSILFDPSMSCAAGGSRYLASIYIDLSCVKAGQVNRCRGSSPMALVLQRGHTHSTFSILLYLPVIIGNLWFPHL